MANEAGQILYVLMISILGGIFIIVKIAFISWEPTVTRGKIGADTLISVCIIGFLMTFRPPEGVERDIAFLIIIVGNIASSGGVYMCLEQQRRRTNPKPTARGNNRGAGSSNA